MRFDMHCHTKEGSPDGKITLKEYVQRLKELGYDGMMVTDHNSYKAYRYYLRNKQDPVFDNFTILKGIEYDTCDAGHILVVMPESVRLPILELRGLPVRLLIEIV
ncbi:MAG: PHP domain-containing protein, partial [Clostridiales bacterium]|nr:PHP domain-containing protein [Clostridiales bacterium]